MKKTICLTLAFALAGSAAALAQGHSERAAVMQSNAATAKQLGGLVANFDAAAVRRHTYWSLFASPTAGVERTIA